MRVLLLLLLAGVAAASPLEGKWDFHMVRPPRAIPRTCLADLELRKEKKGWSGTIQFRRILGHRRVPLAGLAVRGKKFAAQFNLQGEQIELKGALKGESLSGRLAWKGYATFEWVAHRPGLLFEPGLLFDKDLPRGDATKLGLDAEALSTLVVEARKAYTDAVLIVKDGKVVCERTFGHPSGPIETMSVTKFVTAIGIAMLLDERKITSLDAPLSTWFPEWKKGARGQVTLQHVLTHTSGIHHEKLAWQLNNQKDRVAYVRRASVGHEPGTVFSYNNDAIALLGGVFPQACGKQADEYLRKKLFEPLGIKGWTWNRDAAGATVTYAELALTARDLAQIGRLVTDKGRAGKKRVLSEEWIRKFSSPATDVKKDQGLIWQLLLDEKGKAVGVYHTGWLGQWLAVYPADKLVAVRLRRFEDQAENEIVEYEFGSFLRLLRAAMK